MDLKKALDFAKRQAKEAGKIMRQYFRSDKIGMILKDDKTPVTVADSLINKLVIDQVKLTYPNHGVLGEEESFQPEREYVWVVDPIDGTIPFTLGMAISTFCLALVYRGKVLVSVVYEPFQERLFSAISEQGSFLNGQPLKVLSAGSFKSNYAYIGGWFERDNTNMHSVTAELEKQGARILQLLSYSYGATMVASGDLVMACMTYGSPWDAAASSLIVEEAGGVVTDLEGKKRKYNDWGNGILMSCSQSINNKVVGAIKNADTWH